MIPSMTGPETATTAATESKALTAGLELASWVLRIGLAWTASTIAYLLVTFSVTYEGFESLIGQPLVAGFFSLVGIMIAGVLGIPLFLPVVKRHRRRWWWIALLLVPAGDALMILSWLPGFTEEVRLPDGQGTFQSFNTGLAIGGWFMALFGLLHCPVLSLVPLGRFLRRETT